jgi:hypothetical protein
MTERSPTLSDDPAQLRAQLDAALARIADLERLLDELATTTEERERAYACLKEELLNLKRMMFGPRRERLPEAPGQGHLFDEENAPNPPPEPIDEGKDTAGAPSPTICQDRTSSTTWLRPIRCARAGARRRKSART